MNARLIKKILIITTLAICSGGCKKDENSVNIIYGEGAKDIDGNFYQSVIIGDQEWLAQNLKVTHYNDGTPIPNVADTIEWIELSSGAYCWYLNDVGYSEIYGALYNWYAVNNNNICPQGWRVPSDDDWKYLEGYADYLYEIGHPIWNYDGYRGYDAGTVLKSKQHWYTFEGEVFNDGTDDLGFSAVPGGERYHRFIMNFWALGNSALWWTITERDEINAWNREISISGSIGRIACNKKRGLSVRCVRDAD